MGSRRRAYFNTKKAAAYTKTTVLRKHDTTRCVYMYIDVTGGKVLQVVRARCDATRNMLSYAHIRLIKKKKSSVLGGFYSEWKFACSYIAFNTVARDSRLFFFFSSERIN